MDEIELKTQVERLDAARRDAGLIDSVPRVVAAQFGLVPLARRPDGTLEVATVPGCTRSAIAALERALGQKVAAAAFDEGLVQLYLSRVYLKNESLNFHTFEREDFLERGEDVPRLLKEKEMEPEPARVSADPGSVVLLDYAYRSVLEAMDTRSFSVAFDEEAATDLAFVVPPERSGRTESPHPATLSRDSDLPASVVLVARESFSYAGIEHRHGWRRHEVEKLPFMIHPSELQVVGLDADGSLDVFVYDRVERIRPGETPRFDVRYHFLSLGQRMRRRLILKIYGLWSVPRDRLVHIADPLPWDPRHFERWLGHDLA